MTVAMNGVKLQILREDGISTLSKIRFNKRIRDMNSEKSLRFWAIERKCGIKKR